MINEPEHKKAHFRSLVTSRVDGPIHAAAAAGRAARQMCGGRRCQLAAWDSGPAGVGHWESDRREHRADL